jgi:hypothetical protein
LAEKLDRKQLRKPDEFQVVAGKVMTWMAARQKQVIGALLAVVAVVLAAWGLAAYRASRDSKAGTALAEALELQSRPIASGGAVEPGQQAFPNQEERQKAVIAALDKVRSQYGRTAAGQTALAQLGFQRLKAGDAAGAQKDLQDFLSSAAKTHPLRPFAQESLGYALEAQNKLDEARAAFEKLRELDLPGVADLQVARLAVVQGKVDAKQQLERVAKEYAKDPLVVREANERIEISALPPYNAADAAQSTLKTAPAAKPLQAGKAKKK